MNQITTYEIQRLQLTSVCSLILQLKAETRLHGFNYSQRLIAQAFIILLYIILEY